ncbi:hypothetical protein HYS47_05055 [Candidatus Woesearchaeota archaeon]|nr:hypothetical protein [Candidatus Woesearchaeota archaeon]
MDEENVQRVRRKFLDKHDKEDLKHHYESAKQHRLKIMAFFKKKNKQEKETVDDRKRESAPSYPPSKKEEKQIRSLEKQESRIEGKRKQYRALEDSKVKEMARLFDEKEEKKRELAKRSERQKPSRIVESKSGHKHAIKHVKHGTERTTALHLDDRLESHIKERGHEREQLRERQQEQRVRQEKSEDDKEQFRIPAGMDPTSDVYLQKLRELRRGQPVKSQPRNQPLIKIERERTERTDHQLKERNAKEKEEQREKTKERSMEIMHPVKTGMKIGFGFLILIFLIIAILAGVTYLLDMFGISITGMLGLE